ncbi:hypothetical protein C8J57DRAFT_1239150 [Mycena rebaudengoi]|nr:hypothetical protein C8J57DRAFT_1239150 [Mycena rebaudengoi]
MESLGTIAGIWVRWMQGYTAGPEDVGAADMGGADRGGSAVADVRVAAGEGGKEGSAIVGCGRWWSLHNAGGATGRRRGRSRKGRLGLWTLVSVFDIPTPTDFGRYCRRTYSHHPKSPFDPKSDAGKVGLPKGNK